MSFSVTIFCTRFAVWLTAESLVSGLFTLPYPPARVNILFLASLETGESLFDKKKHVLQHQVNQYFVPNLLKPQELSISDFIYFFLKQNVFNFMHIWLLAMRISGENHRSPSDVLLSSCSTS